MDQFLTLIKNNENDINIFNTKNKLLFLIDQKPKKEQIQFLLSKLDGKILKKIV